MLSLAMATTARQRPRMVASDNIREAQALGLALKALRQRVTPKLTQQAAGALVNVSDEGWRKYEAGAPSLFKPATQQRLAAALGFTVDDLMAEYRRIRGDDSEGAAIIRLPVEHRAISEQMTLPYLGSIQAGAWLPTDDGFYAPRPRTYPLAPDRRFKPQYQWVEDVRGDSMNKLGIFDGDQVHLVSIQQSAYTPVTDDILKIERIRFQGREREVSLKQLEIVDDKHLLWPRSTNPAWQEPIDLHAETKPGEEIEVHATALVLNVIRQLWRPGARV